MSIRFLADEDVRVEIIQGLCSREPAIDFLDVKTSGLRGTKDPPLLDLAANEDRIVITHDRQTMTRHFCDRLKAGLPAPGLFVVPQDPDAIGPIIDWLFEVWAEDNPDDWRNQIVYGPPPR